MQEFEESLILGELIVGIIIIILTVYSNFDYGSQSIFVARIIGKWIINTNISHCMYILFDHSQRTLLLLLPEVDVVMFWSILRICFPCFAFRKCLPRVAFGRQGVDLFWHAFGLSGFLLLTKSKLRTRKSRVVQYEKQNAFWSFEVDNDSVVHPFFADCLQTNYAQSNHY